LTNLAGTVTDTYNYDAFGNLLNSTGSTPNNYLYRGEQYDSDLNLYYLRARYMNPVTGRFMSRDPEDGKPYDPKTLHKYLYAGADPIDFRDPLGRELDEVVTLDRRSLTASEKYAAQQLGVTRRLLRVAIHAVKAAATFEGNPDVLIGVVGEAYNILGNVYLEEAEADYELIGNLFDYLP
jgi:RHS repeat-associated protein